MRISASFLMVPSDVVDIDDEQLTALPGSSSCRWWDESADSSRGHPSRNRAVAVAYNSALVVDSLHPCSLRKSA